MLSETFNLRKKIQFLNLLSWNWIWASLVMFAATQFRAEQKRKKKKNHFRAPRLSWPTALPLLTWTPGWHSGLRQIFPGPPSSLLFLRPESEIWSGHVCVSCFSIFIWYQSLRINILPALLHGLLCDSTAFYIYIQWSADCGEKATHVSCSFLHYSTHMALIHVGIVFLLENECFPHSWKPQGNDLPLQNETVVFYGWCVPELANYHNTWNTK